LRGSRPSAAPANSVSSQKNAHRSLARLRRVLAADLGAVDGLAVGEERGGRVVVACAGGRQRQMLYSGRSLRRAYRRSRE
jgi:hypothetical protein